MSVLAQRGSTWRSRLRILAAKVATVGSIGGVMVLAYVRHPLRKQCSFMVTVSVLVACSIGVGAFAAEATPQANAVTLSVDGDLVALLKGAVWTAGIFLGAFALLGVAFFGWDVRRARASIMDAQKETTALLTELKRDFQAMKDLKEKLEQLGPQLEEAAEGQSGEASMVKDGSRSNIDLIREVIASSNFEWTTVGRVVQRTGLTRDNVLEEVRKAPDIRIGTGRKTKDFIFRFQDREQ